MQKQISDISQTPKRPQVLSVRYATRPLTRKRKIILTVFAIIIALIAGLCIWYHWSYSAKSFVDGGKYQAIFTTNNQAYFGKMQILADGSYRMTNVYYLQQAGTTAQRANTDDQTPQLVKMGSELHGPEDAIVFPTEQVQFWENLKADSKVTKAINDYLKK